MSIAKCIKSNDGWVIAEVTKTETMRLVFKSIEDTDEIEFRAAFILKESWYDCEQWKEAPCDDERIIQVH